MTTSEYPVQLEPPAARITGDRFELEVRVRNDADRALLVVDEIRAVEWDPTTRTIHVWLGDRDTLPGGTCKIRKLPKTCALPVRETVTVPVSLPRELWRLTPLAGGNAMVEHIDLREAEHVEVHVTVADGPYYPPSPQLDTKAKAPWGQRATVRARVGTAPRSA